MSKRCLPMHSCGLRSKCALAMTKLEGNVQHFSPPTTGEDCHFYRPKRMDDDLVERLTRMAGAME